MSKLTCYQYIGQTTSGYRIKAEIEALSPVLAKFKLYQQGIIPIKLRKKRDPIFTIKAIHQLDLSILTRQLAAMMSAGIPLVQSFDIILKDLNKPRLSQLIQSIKRDLEMGFSLYEALSKHPQYFNKLHCQLIRAGERSGALEPILLQIANYREKMDATKKKVKQALRYPIVVFFITVIISFALLLLVIPQFETLFKGFNAHLPPLTRTTLALSRTFCQHWLGILATLILTSVYLTYLKQMPPWFIAARDRLLLSIPRLGLLLKQAAIAHFTRTLNITFAAGLPLVEALDAVTETCANSVYSKACHYIKEALIRGQPLSVSLQKTALFPPLVIQMITVGEESGQLETMLKQLATFYEEEVQQGLDALTSLLEPLVMCVLGILISGLILSMYLPLFTLSYQF